MNKKGLTPIISIALIIMFAIALATVVMNLTEAEVHEEPSQAIGAEPTLCNPADALKMRFVNQEITEHEYDAMKAKIEER